jgi:hypothetical protein
VNDPLRGCAPYPLDSMEEVDLERLVLPALLALLLLGAFVIVATSGGGNPATPVTPLPAQSAPARPAQDRQSPTPQHRFVKVQEGDTPASIAAAAGITTDRLIELNPSMDPSSLHPGQTLKLAP